MVDWWVIRDSRRDYVKEKDETGNHGANCGDLGQIEGRPTHSIIVLQRVEMNVQTYKRELAC